MPHTGWLEGTLARDEQGFILTGAEVAAQDEHPWPLDRQPMLLETSLPGVFAAGDVRHGSVKRVASAVGAGSIAVQLAHLRLAELERATRSELEFGVQAGWPRIASAIRGKSGHRRAGRWRKPGGESRRKVEQKADRRGGISGDSGGKGETVG